MTDQSEREKFIEAFVKIGAPTPKFAAFAWDNNWDHAQIWQARAALDVAASPAGEDDGFHFPTDAEITTKLNNEVTSALRAPKPADGARDKAATDAPDSSNYVADDDTYPSLVIFADGRTVAITEGSEGHYLVVSRKTRSYDALVLDSVGIAKTERGRVELADILEEHRYGQIYLHPSEVSAIVSALRSDEARDLRMIKFAVNKTAGKSSFYPEELRSDFLAVEAEGKKG